MKLNLILICCLVLAAFSSCNKDKQTPTPPKPATLTSITFQTDTVNILVNQTAQLHVTYKPSNAVDTALTYSLSDTTVATINQYGLLTAKRIGGAIVTATNKTKSVKATCFVKVLPIAADSVRLNFHNVAISDIDTIKLSAVIKPSNASDKNLIWATSDATVATVNNGTVKAVKVGNANITVSNSGKTVKDICSVSVVDFPGLIEPILSYDLTNGGADEEVLLSFANSSYSNVYITRYVIYNSKGNVIEDEDYSGAPMLVAARSNFHDIVGTGNLKYQEPGNTTGIVQWPVDIYIQAGNRTYKISATGSSGTIVRLR